MCIYIYYSICVIVLLCVSSYLREFGRNDHFEYWPTKSKFQKIAGGNLHCVVVFVIRSTYASLCEYHNLFSLIFSHSYQFFIVSLLKCYTLFSSFQNYFSFFWLIPIWFAYNPRQQKRRFTSFRNAILQDVYMKQETVIIYSKRRKPDAWSSQMSNFLC